MSKTVRELKRLDRFVSCLGLVLIGRRQQRNLAQTDFEQQHGPITQIGSLVLLRSDAEDEITWLQQPTEDQLAEASQLTKLPTPFLLFRMHMGPNPHPIPQEVVEIVIGRRTLLSEYNSA